MMLGVRLEDHEEELKALKERLVIDPARTAVVTIDMHRGHLDPVHGTLPVPVEESKRVLRHTADLLGFAREHRIPVIHVILTIRPFEVGKVMPRLGAGMVLSPHAPMTEARKQGLPHNLEGSIQTELMPEVGPAEGDIVIDNKKTLSIFLGTELDIVLRVLGVDTLVLTGINTNTCVQCAAFDATNRGYKPVVISDCVASMYGEDLHIFGLQNIARCLGWVLTVDEFKEKVLSWGR